MDEKETWIPSIDVCKKASIEELRFIFDQATKRVEQTAKEGDDLYAKSIGIVTICLPILTALAGYGAIHVSNTPQFYAVVAVSVILIITVCRIKSCIYLMKYRGSGSYPERLLIADFYENLYEGKSSEWHMIMSEIIRYQERINLNVRNNNFRVGRINQCYGILYSIPIVVLVVVGLYYLISSPCLRNFLHPYCH